MLRLPVASCLASVHCTLQVSVLLPILNPITEYVRSIAAAYSKSPLVLIAAPRRTQQAQKMPEMIFLVNLLVS